MVNLTLDKPYTVHARSIDRYGESDTSSQYKLILRDPITCPNDMYMKATLISASVPSSFYQIDERNNKFTVGFNRPTHTLFAQYSGQAVQSPLTGKPNRADYEREVVVELIKGNYDVDTLATELQSKLNAACTAAHTVEPFRTFTRGSGTDASFKEDWTDGLILGALTDAEFAALSLPTHSEAIPQFEVQHSKIRNKLVIRRTDIAGKMVLGKWDIQTKGVKLAYALGLSHVTAQLLRRLDLPDSVKTAVETSIHYRETSDTEINDFAIQTPTTPAGNTTYGHSIASPNYINMFAHDSVYLHIQNLPNNAYTTLGGGSTTVMAVIPMSTAQSEAFHVPTNPTSCNIGAMKISELDIKCTNAAGDLINFNGGEHDSNYSLKHPNRAREQTTLSLMYSTVLKTASASCAVYVRASTHGTL